MSAEHTSGRGPRAGEGSGAERPLTEVALSLVPLDYVAEWRRCGDTADYLARFVAYNFEDRETAASVLSTVINELVENAVKFSDDKHAPARLLVRHYADRVQVDAANRTSVERAARFASVLAELVDGDPEALFARRVADPPETGGPGIGLIMLRKDYGATLGVRMTPSGADREVEVQVTIPSREVEQR